MELQSMRLYFFWGTTRHRKDRAGFVHVAKLSCLSLGCFCGTSEAGKCMEKPLNLCLWRVPAREGNVGNAVMLGWDLLSLAWDLWHNCPFEDFQHQAFRTCQRHTGQPMEGQSSATMCRIQTGTHTHTSYGYSMMPKFIQTSRAHNLFRDNCSFSPTLTLKNNFRNVLKGKNHNYRTFLDRRTTNALYQRHSVFAWTSALPGRMTFCYCAWEAPCTPTEGGRV